MQRYSSMVSSLQPSPLLPYKYIDKRSNTATMNQEPDAETLSPPFNSPISGFESASSHLISHLSLLYFQSVTLYLGMIIPFL